MTPTLTAESEEELQSLLMKVKEESEKAGLKINIPKTKITASSPITSWQTDGEAGETLFSGAPRLLWTMTAAMKLKDACSLEEVMTNLDRGLKSKGITLLTMVHIVKARLPWWLSGKESTYNAGDLRDTGSIPGSGRSPGRGHGNPLQYSCLENPMDKGTL